MLAMVYLAPVFINFEKHLFENILQLKRFGLYFEIILNSKWLYFHIEIIISATEMLGGSEACSPRKF